MFSKHNLCPSLAVIIFVGCERANSEIVQKPQSVSQRHEETSRVRPRNPLGIRVNNTDPDLSTGVQIDVIGAYRKNDAEFVRSLIKPLIPEANTHAWPLLHNHVSYKASPVHDVELLAKKIEESGLGRSVELEGRNIRVIYRYDHNLPEDEEGDASSNLQYQQDRLGPALEKHNGDWWAAIRSIDPTVKRNDSGEITELRLSSATDATMRLISDLNSLCKLDIGRSDVTDLGAMHLTNLVNLQVLDLEGTDIGDTGLSAIKDLYQLRSLELSGKGTHFGLRHLADLSNLQELSINSRKDYPIDAKSLGHLADLTDLQSLDFGYCEITDEAMPIIGKFRELRRLDLRGSRITDAGMAQLSDLGKIKDLNLGDCEAVTDAGIRVISNFRDLKSLSLTGTQLTDAGISAFHSHSGLNNLSMAGTHILDEGVASLIELTNLKTLDLSNTAVTDQAMKSIQVLDALTVLNLSATEITGLGLEAIDLPPRLRHLYLSETSLSDSALKSLTRCSELTDLWLSNCGITDDGLKHVGKLKNLRTLWIGRNQITDRGMQHLSQLTRLRSLELFDTQVTIAGLRHLRNAEYLTQIHYGADSKLKYQDVEEFINRKR